VNSLHFKQLLQAPRVPLRKPASLSGKIELKIQSRRTEEQAQATDPEK
jgi:hypothetical protein